MRYMKGAVAMAAAMALLLVGCSDDSDEPSGTPASNEGELTFEEWQAATTAVCEEYEPRGEELTSSEAEPTSLTDALESLDALADFAGEYRAALQAVGVPAERSDEVAQFYETRAAIAELIRQLRDAVESGNESDFVAVSEQLEQATDDVDQDAVDLGVPACA